jgi:hypothetical protein
MGARCGVIFRIIAFLPWKLATRLKTVGGIWQLRIKVSQSHPENFQSLRVLCCRGHVQVIQSELSGDATSASWFDTVSSTYSY